MFKGEFFDGAFFVFLYKGREIVIGRVWQGEFAVYFFEYEGIHGFEQFWFHGHAGEVGGVERYKEADFVWDGAIEFFEPTTDIAGFSGGEDHIFEVGEGAGLFDAPAVEALIDDIFPVRFEDGEGLIGVGAEATAGEAWIVAEIFPDKMFEGGEAGPLSVGDDFPPVIFAGLAHA